MHISLPLIPSVALLGIFALPVSAQSNCEALRAEAARLSESHVRSLVSLQSASDELDAADAALQTLMPDSADMPNADPESRAYRYWQYWVSDPLYNDATDLAEAIDPGELGRHNGGNPTVVGAYFVAAARMASYRQALDRVRAAEARARSLLNTLETQQTALVATFRILERDCGGVRALEPPRDPGIRDGTFQGRAAIRAGSDCIADAYSIEIEVTGDRFDGAFLRHGGARDGEPFPVRGSIEADGELIPEAVGGVNRESFDIRFVDGGIVGEWNGGGCFMTFTLSRQR